MRKISIGEGFVFSLLCLPSFVGAFFISRFFYTLLPENAIVGVILVLFFIFLTYIFLILTYRLFITFFPLSTGEIALGSRAQSIYHIHILFFLIWFYILMRPYTIPMPFAPIFYTMLGARIGSNSYGAGILFDPLFITIGNDVVWGYNSALIPHVIEGEKLAHHKIFIGNKVTIGVNAVILPGVTIGDRSIIAANSVVSKHVTIPAGEVWGGTPAHFIKKV